MCVRASERRQTRRAAASQILEVIFPWWQTSKEKLVVTLRVEVPYASFRKSFARSFAETYPLPPPATVYGMLLSLVGERFRKRHEGVQLAFAYKHVPRIATTLRKLSRFKYGVPGKQWKLGNAPDFI